MILTAPHDWSFPVPIIYGPGRLREIGTLCNKAGMTRPLIVTDRNSAALPFMDNLRTQLKTAGLPCSVYSGFSPNPRDDEIVGGCIHYLGGAHDGIIAIGGGSGMDGGKAIALTVNNDIDLWAFEYEQTPPDMAAHRPFPPLICIPTTAGTGAETDGTAMITDTAKKMKWCVWHPDLKPSFALLDAELTVGLPRDLTAWTGIDAMSHAIEAYCVPGFHPLCDAMALEGLRLISRWLPVAAEEPANLEARGAMLAGSCLAGIAFTKGLGMVHAISHMLGAEFDTQHGLTNAVLLPSVLRHNAPAIECRVGPMAQAIGAAEPTSDALNGRVCNLLDQMDIPTTLTKIGVPPDCAPRIAAKAILDSAAATNPLPLTQPDICQVIEHALLTGR